MPVSSKIECFANLYDTTIGRILMVVNFVIVSEDDRLELLTRVYLRIWTKMVESDNYESTNYHDLLEITVRSCFEKEELFHNSPAFNQYLTLMHLSAAGSNNYVEGDDIIYLFKLLPKIPLLERNFIFLFVFWGYDYCAIGEILQIPENKLAEVKESAAKSVFKHLIAPVA